MFEARWATPVKREKLITSYKKAASLLNLPKVKAEGDATVGKSGFVCKENSRRGNPLF